MPVEKHEFDVFGDPVKVRHYVKNGVVHTEISGLGWIFAALECGAFAPSSNHVRCDRTSRQHDAGRLQRRVL